MNMNTKIKAQNHLLVLQLSTEVVRLKAQRDELACILKAWNDWSEGKCSWPKLSTNVALRSLEKEANQNERTETLE